MNEAGNWSMKDRTAVFLDQVYNYVRRNKETSNMET